MTDPARQTLLSLDEMSLRLRPKLLRYAARMSGSMSDGEDIVQDALMRAHAAAPLAASVSHPDAWLFRITHNAAVDHIRRQRRAPSSGELVAIMGVEPIDEAAHRQDAAGGLRLLMDLSTLERSCMILADILGYALSEVAEMTGLSLASVKAALHRGRGRLRERGLPHPDDLGAAMTAHAQSRLAAYVERFNARDFDALRALLAEDVRLELAGRAKQSGKAMVSNYFGNYAGLAGWRVDAGMVDGQPAVLFGDAASGALTHFALIDFAGEEIIAIHDFRYAPQVMAVAEVSAVGQSLGRLG